MKERLRQSLVIGTVSLVLLALAGETAPRRKVIKEVVAGPGLTGGGTGPKVTLQAALAEGPGPDGTLTELARPGLAAPGGGTFSGVTLDITVTNGRGVWAFTAGVSATQGDSTAVFVATQQGTTRLAGAGDLMPDGSTLDAFMVPLLVSDTGRIYIAARTALPYVDGVSDTVGIYGWDGSQWFTVVGRGSQTADGKPVYGPLEYVISQAPASLVRVLGPRAIGIPVQVWNGTVSQGGLFTFQSP